MKSTHYPTEHYTQAPLAKAVRCEILNTEPQNTNCIHPAPLLTTTKNLNGFMFYNNESELQGSCGHEDKANDYVNEGNNDDSNKVDSNDDESGG